MLQNGDRVRIPDGRAGKIVSLLMGQSVGELFDDGTPEVVRVAAVLTSDGEVRHFVTAVLSRIEFDSRDHASVESASE